MKKLIMFFAGLLLMVLMILALGVSGAIYDTASKATVDTFFFQPADNFFRRPGVPASATDLGESGMRDRLIEKFITEYYYVTPDAVATAERIVGRTSLRRMATTPVFTQWQSTVAPEIEKLSQDRVLRTVSLIGATMDTDGRYWVVEYELKTWRTPNNMSQLPTTKRGIMYMDIIYEPGMRDQMGQISVEQYLERGGDPAAVFRFAVRDVVAME